MRSPQIVRGNWDHVSQLYASGLSMQAVSERIGVSIDAVTYVLRKTGTKRRSPAESNKIIFESKEASFTLRNKQSIELNIAGAMLYWAEGYKAVRATGLDFANSDPVMASLFMKFLRSRYSLNEKRIRLHIYCYSNQDIPGLIRYWSRLLHIPSSQIGNPHVRKKFSPDKRQMPYGVVHIRYSDKKLLRDILNLIDSYKQQYAV